MPELLFEILSEEIPARMQARAAADLAGKLRALVDEAGFSGAVGEGDVETFVTPRRLVGVVRNLPAVQPDVTVERKGPRVGAPEQAIAGFLRSAGLGSLDDCEIREIKGNRFYFAVRVEKGRPTAEVLAEKLPGIVRSFSWPRSMRWASTAVRWVRPIHGVLAVFDGAIVPGEVGMGSTDPEVAEVVFPFTDRTRGHRFLAPEPFAVADFADYRAKLERAFVLLDRDARMEAIRERAAALAAAEGLAVREDPELLREVAGLVEWPVPLMGEIDAAYMDLPPEVLTTAMRTHQKYFAVEDGSGRLAPRFVVVANVETTDGGRAIVAGNERVLRARLADARFFWDQDRRTSLASRTPALRDIVFHARLGTLDEKVDRMQALAAALADHVPGADKDRVRSAARLAKADLVTEMVGEFPELQGVMGRYYALADGEHPEVADAIAEHYAPRGPNDRCPTAPVSVAVALADRIDTLVGFWAIGEKPTGSKDPYALRRAALGVIRLILENGLRLPLRRVFADAVPAQPVEADPAAVADGLLDFFADRLKVHLREKGVRHDLITAIFALGDEDDLVRLLARVDALGAFLETEDGANLLVAYRRAANIVRIEEKKDDARYDGPVDEALFAEGAERALADALGRVESEIADRLAAEDFTGAMAALARLRAPVDSFFDEVTVNAEDPALRANRLRLLSRIRATMDRIADFSRIEG